MKVNYKGKLVDTINVDNGMKNLSCNYLYPKWEVVVVGAGGDCKFTDNKEINERKDSVGAVVSNSLESQR